MSMHGSAARTAWSKGIGSGHEPCRDVARSCSSATTPPISCPPQFGTLGLDASRPDAPHRLGSGRAAGGADAWRRTLDAALVESGVSRLVIDCNRPLDAPDLIPPISETTAIPGNAALDRRRARRAHRACPWQPFHDAIDDAGRGAAGRPAARRWLVSVHSFTPVYKGVRRPWQIGIIHDDDKRLSAPLIAALEAMGADRRRQPALFAGRPRLLHAGAACALARASLRDDRNPQRRDPKAVGQQKQWAGRLAGIFADLEPDASRERRTGDGNPKAGLPVN